MDVQNATFSGWVRVFDAEVTMSADDCKDICVNNITSCDLVGYEFGTSFMNKYCSCLYDDGSVPSSPGADWSSQVSNGTAPVFSSDGGECMAAFNLICYSYTVSVIRVLAHLFRLLPLDQSHKDLCKPF